MKFIRCKDDKKKRKLISILMTSVLAFSILNVSIVKVYATTDKEDFVIVNEKIANGVQYIEQKRNYYNTGGSSIQLKQTLNIIKADLNNSDAGLIFAKAKDVVLAKDSVSKQIGQEISKNNSVVGGVNGDFFNMVIGASVGPQIIDGKLLVGYTCKSDQSRYPIFGIDKSGKSFIENLSFSGKLINDSNTNVEQGSLLIDSVNRYGEFEVNKYSVKNSLMLLTPDYSQDRKIKQSVYAPSEVLTVIRAVDGPVLLDKQFTGVIESMGVGSKEVTIPEDGIVIASNGTKATWVKGNLKVGDKVSFDLGFNKKDIASAVGGYNYLVKNGKALSAEAMVSAGVDKSLATSRKARTAIGITSDNTVVALTVGGGLASAEFSDGATLPEMANFMVELGAVTALNFDGGGSAQMNVQRYAENDNTIVNVPSDGSERAVTNTILFTNKAPITNIIGDIIIKENILIYKKSSYKFSIKGVDTNLHPINFSDKNVNWSTQGEVGQVNSKGEFIASDIATIGTVEASLDGTVASATVTVLDSLASLSLTDKNPISLKQGDTHQFSLKASNENGENVIIDNKSVYWTVTGSDMQIDENGLLKVTGKGATGEVIVEAGGKRAVIKIEDLDNDDEAVKSGNEGIINLIKKNIKIIKQYRTLK